MNPFLKHALKDFAEVINKWEEMHGLFLDWLLRLGSFTKGFGASRHSAVCIVLKETQQSL